MFDQTTAYHSPTKLTRKSFNSLLMRGFQPTEKEHKIQDPTLQRKKQGNRVKDQRNQAWELLKIIKSSDSQVSPRPSELELL